MAIPLTKIQKSASPVRTSERFAILDILRGLALLGIALANFPEFSLYTFLSAEATQAFPTARIDSVVRFLQYVFIDGKFYTLFSLLFGIGFSIIISNAIKKGANGFRIFYRRMGILTLIGFLHLMFIWSGDILMLYALLGLFLPRFRNASDRALLTWAGALLFLPILIDLFIEIRHIYPATPVVHWQHYYCAKYGITEENFAYWLRDADNYQGMFEFLIQGALVRVQEFIDGNRYFKVMGLFLIGFYIGRKRMYADLESLKPFLKQLFRAGMLIGLPYSVLYAWSAMNQHPFGLAAHSVLYCISVYPLGFAYMAGVCLFFLRKPDWKPFHLFAFSGRMALSNYIGQSLWGIAIFYGIGLELGASMGLIYVLLIATGVYIIESLFSSVWLRHFQFGLLEWIWRMLTYGKRFPLYTSGNKF